jgi:hypothetical protein
METEVGLGGSARQIGGGESKKKAEDRQRARGGAAECDLNGILCGAEPRKGQP